MQRYGNHILRLYERTIEALMSCQIPSNIIDYRHEYTAPRRPTAAHSNFLINRQLGDWTESLLKIGFNHKFEEFKALRYGAAGRLVAGDVGFKEMFRKYHEEIREIGKRPDLLLFKREHIDNLNLPDDISEFEPSRLLEIAKVATRAIEVRSSRYLASKYRETKGKEQSFTPKLEDLPILTHWIVKHGVPCFYTQVFFDEVHMISFERILQIIQDTGDEYIRRMERNQRKSTFYIPVSEGVLIGQITDAPIWKAKTKVMSDGRVIIYATPQGGRMNVNMDMLNRYLGL